MVRETADEDGDGTAGQGTGCLLDRRWISPVQGKVKVR